MKSILSIILFSIPCLLSSQVNIAIGDIPAGKSIQIIFDVEIDDPFPDMTPSVSSQGTVSGGNFANVLTDDPDEVGVNNPTLTEVSVCEPPNYFFVGPGTDINDSGNWLNGCIPPNDPANIITIQAGQTCILSGTITGTVLNYGTFKGTGTVNGDVTNYGTTSPGN